MAKLKENVVFEKTFKKGSPLLIKGIGLSIDTYHKFLIVFKNDDSSTKRWIHMDKIELEDFELKEVKEIISQYQNLLYPHDNHTHHK